MPVNLVTPILNVSDVHESVAWFEKLGWDDVFLWSEDDGSVNFGGVGDGSAQIFLCRDCQGARGTDAPWMSWFVGSLDEVDALHELAVRLGYDVTMPPTDEPWGVREFHLRHPDGHTFRVGCHGRRSDAA